VAICKTCGKKYSRWTTPVSASGVCTDCFEAELGVQRDLHPQEAVSPAPITAPTPSKIQIAPIRLVSFLPRTRSKIVFVLVMGCYSIVFGSVMSTWAWVAHLSRPPRSFYLRGDATDVFALLIFAPLVESLMLVGVFELIRRVHAPNLVQVITSALFISALHVRPWWPHAFIVLPSFLVQCASYLYWRHRGPWKDAYWVLVGIHALNNFIPALSMVGWASRH
jgi:hypothetical protein